MSLGFYLTFFLLTFPFLSYAQNENNTILYLVSRDTGVKNWWQGARANSTTLREAHMQFTPESLLFISQEKTDTIPFAKIDQVYRNLYKKRTFTFLFDKRKGYVALRFCKKKGAMDFDNVISEKKVNYKKPKIFTQIVFAPLIPFVGDTAMPGIDTKYKWRRNCK